jgi:pimeloyl-ACP methyl ester carboxylesterase
MPTRPTATERLATRLRRNRLSLQRQRQAIAERPRIYAAILLVIVLFLAAIAWPFTRAHLQAVAVLDLASNKPVPWLLQKLTIEPVATSELTLPLPSGPVRARMYTPLRTKDAPTLLVLHGVHHLGMDEPRMIAFATAMAACGIRVLTPELPGIKDYQVDVHTIPVIGDAANWFSQQTGGAPVGVMGLSFSGSLSLLAAANPAYRPHIKFVVAIGSEDQMSRVADYYRTGEDARPHGRPEELKPHEYGPLVIEYEHLADFVPKQDLSPLREVLRAHLYEDVPAETAAMARLDEGQRAEARELMDMDSPITHRLLAQAETHHVQDMAGVSPHGHLAELTTPVYLLHGEGDNIIPSAETQWMTAELPTQTLQASLISPVLSHLDLDAAQPGILDELRLLHFFALVLRAAQSQ